MIHYQQTIMSRHIITAQSIISIPLILLAHLERDFKYHFKIFVLLNMTFK